MVKNYQTNEIILYCYGADSQIQSRLSTEFPQPYLEAVLKQCEDWSILGHRTLFVAMKVISQEEWDAFQSDMVKIAEDPQRIKKRWELISDMENDLFGIGATCVEDKL